LPVLPRRQIAGFQLSTDGFPQIAPELVVFGRKTADHKFVPECHDPPFTDPITAQFTAQFSCTDRRSLGWSGLGPTDATLQGDGR
jgi:hypothetical protein